MSFVHPTSNPEQQVITQIELGWIAGILDGEGSIGIIRRKAPSGNFTYFPCVQMTTTSRKTAEEVVRLVDAIGIKGRSYLYNEKKPEKHKPSYHIRTVRLVDVLLLCKTIGPFSIEKKDQWEVVERFCKSRIGTRETLPSGRLSLKGPQIHYTEKEKELWANARFLNKTGRW